MSIGLFIEGIAVVVVSLFKGVRSQAYILLTLLLGGDCTLVDHVGGLAASLQHTAVSAAPAVAASLHLLLHYACHSPVVAGYDTGHVWHARIAHLHSVPVEVLVEGRLLAKVFVY